MIPWTWYDHISLRILFLVPKFEFSHTFTAETITLTNLLSAVAFTDVTDA